MISSDALSANIRCVLFDLDNTLVHRKRSIAAYADSFIEDFGTRLESPSATQVARLIELQDNGGYLSSQSPFSTIKDAVAATLTNYLKWKRFAALEEVRTHWNTHFPRHAVEMEGAAALVSSLADRRYAIGIVSNGSEQSRADTVASLSFQRHVTCLLSSERACARKPNPEIFIKVANELGVAPRECLFVGDHPSNDVMGARAAGMYAIWLKGFHPWPSHMPRHVAVANTLSEVGALIEKWENQCRKFAASLTTPAFSNSASGS